MALKLGNSAKDSKYLERIKKAIAQNERHPRHHGVKMQAHHLISAEGVKRSGLGRKLEEFGYDINLLPNLTFIPCTLQGACYLGVQPHRGNHTHPIEGSVDQDSYDDDLEPKTYHDMVAVFVRKIEAKLQKECPGENKVNPQRVISEMDKLSKIILGFIQNAPTQAPLTRIAMYYIPGSKIGCGGVDSVSAHKGQPCPCERRHKNTQGPRQKAENIRYTVIGRYGLEVGK